MKSTPCIVVAVGVLALMWRTVLGGGPSPLDSYAFLVGEWEASGGGQPGQGTGKTVFTRSLQDRVIVRTNSADYPASKDKPASRHDDLMVVYASGSAVRADYYDSEGHVIRYTVSAPAAGEALFVSDAVAGEPRYRLSYKLDASGVLNGEFSLAPQGQAEFKRYLAWQSRRSKAAGK